MAKNPTLTTEDQEPSAETIARARVPGVAIVFAGGVPTLRVIPLVGGRLVLGRDLLGDDKVSREHAEVHYANGSWVVRDLGSRNGTFVDGERVTEAECEAPRVLRVGHTLCLLRADAGRLRDQKVQVLEGVVAGPTVSESFLRIERAGRTSEGLLVTGDTGTGKELAARLFHKSGPRAAGPFVPVNCAAIPQTLAESLLFGSRKGAFSGATDARGYVSAADGGTLFLDELAELDLAVQAKLLRVIETRTVTPLGASRPTPVDLRVCVATHADLRARVAAGRFRQDLYFRIGRPEVHLPTLRERAEDVSWLVAEVVRRTADGLVAHARLVEACLVRAWPGNVREICGVVAEAAHGARAAGRDVVQPEDLPEAAGVEFSPSTTRQKTREPERSIRSVGPEQIRDVLAREGGNVSAAARALGLHRTQIRRLVKKLGWPDSTS